MSEFNPPEKELTDGEKTAQELIKLFGDRISMWAKAHGNVKIPVIKDAQGRWRWLNREERRRMLKKHRKTT